MNVGQMLAAAARRRPKAPAVTQGGRTVTYDQLDERSDALAHGLAALGLAKQDRVAVLMRNAPELLECMYACFKAGYGWVPLNARFTADEVAFHVHDSGAAVVVTDLAGIEAVEAAELPGAQVVAVGAPDRSGLLDYETVLERGAGKGSAVAQVGRDDLAWLFYTSGTTGKPKGAMLTHGVLDFVTASWLADLTPLDETDVTLHAAPLTHGAGFHALATTARGAHHVLTEPGSFEPATVFELMVRERVTNTWLVPTQIVMLTDAAADRPPLPDLRRVVYGGAAFAPAELRRALDEFGPIFVQLFGQGETPMTATFLPPAAHAAALAGDHPERLGSAGYNRPGMDVRVVDSDDRELAPGEVGEVVVRGPAVMTGYWQRHEASEQTLRGGWLHTGDLGRMDEVGYLYLLDRAKDMIITGGSNVYAVEVEAVLAEHEAVRDVAVVGLPDRTWGELVTAVVVSDAPPGSAEPLLTEHCSARMAGYKRPRRFVLVDELPRNAYGKVLKRELRANLAESAPS